jgi:hypothetical protein
MALILLLTAVFKSDLGHFAELSQSELLLHCLQLRVLGFLEKLEQFLCTLPDLAFFVVRVFSELVTPWLLVLCHLEGEVKS